MKIGREGGEEGCKIGIYEGRKEGGGGEGRNVRPSAAGL
jgi:hypothetical protein